MTTEEAVAWLAEQDGAEAQWFHEGDQPRCSVYIRGYSITRDTLAEAVARVAEHERRAGR